MQLKGDKRIFGLDLMRAVAIFLVIFSHLVWILPNKNGLVPDLLSVAGVIGVEIFFVLSGFLIGRIIYRFYTAPEFSKKDIIYFWIRRWFRTLPNYYLALVLNIFVTLGIGLALPKTIWQYPFFVQNFAWEISPFFYESWSLTIEEFAYILGPLALYIISLKAPKLSRSKTFLVTTLLILLFFLLAKVAYHINLADHSMAFWNLNVKSILIYRLDAVYYGVLAAYVSMVKPTIWKRVQGICFLVAVGMFFVLNFGIPLKGLFIESYPALWNIWYLPVNSIAIVLALPLLSQWKKAPKWLSWPITKFSILSYAMYVLHYSVIMQLLKYYVPTDTLRGFDIFVYMAVYFGLLVLSAYLVYSLYEKPLTNLRDHPRIKHRFIS